MDFKVYVRSVRIGRNKIARLLPFVKGQYVQRALANLRTLPQRSSGTLSKAIKSGMANALFTNRNLNPDTLWVKEARVDMGTRLKRSQPMPRGSAGSITKMYSHVALTLTSDVKPEKIRKKKGAGIIAAPVKEAAPEKAAAPVKTAAAVKPATTTTAKKE